MPTLMLERLNLFLGEEIVAAAKGTHTPDEFHLAAAALLVHAATITRYSIGKSVIELNGYANTNLNSNTKRSRFDRSGRIRS